MTMCSQQPVERAACSIWVGPPLGTPCLARAGELGEAYLGESCFSLCAAFLFFSSCARCHRSLLMYIHG